jgi:SAM-dependent methyltransferase
MSYDPTIYQGAAAHYGRGRPAYSPQLEAVLSEELDLDGTGRLLDAGCGPGILTVRLAHLFEEAVGLDPDPAMLTEGRRTAHERGITNIRWVQALAEDLPGRHRDRTEWLPSASPSTGRTKPVSPRPCTTCWRRAAPWP